MVNDSNFWPVALFVGFTFAMAMHLFVFPFVVTPLFDLILGKDSRKNDSKRI